MEEINRNWLGIEDGYYLKDKIKFIDNYLKNNIDLILSFSNDLENMLIDIFEKNFLDVDEYAQKYIESYYSRIGEYSKIQAMTTYYESIMNVLENKIKKYENKKTKTENNIHFGLINIYVDFIHNNKEKIEKKQNDFFK